MEDDAVVEAVACELHEVLDGLRRVVGKELDHDRAVVRVHRRVHHQRVREWLDRMCRRLDLAGLELLRDLACKLLGLALLIRVEDGVHGGEHVAAASAARRRPSRARARGMYGSSGTPTCTTTLRPSGSVAVCSIGFAPSGSYGSQLRPWLRKRSRPTLPRCCSRAGRRERVVYFRPRTVFARHRDPHRRRPSCSRSLWISRHVLSWIFIALFLALALNPAVDRLERAASAARRSPTGVVYIAALAAIAAIGCALHPDARRPGEQLRRAGARTTSTT